MPEQKTEDRRAANAAMDRYADGDDDAFGELYDLLAPKLLAFAQRQVRDAARAEDVVQQALLQLHCARASYAHGAEVVPWAFTIARRVMIDGHRRAKRETHSGELDEQDPPGSEPMPDDVLQGKETAVQVASALASLPETQRLAFEFVRYEGLSAAEAALVLGTTPNAVRLRTHRTSEVLRAALAVDSPGDRS